MQEILLELLKQLPGELLLEVTLLLAGTFILWCLMPIVRQGIGDGVPLPRPIQYIVAGIGIVFAYLLPLALAVWFISILFRYL